ncbi:4-diphosphocytidyl-2C-methyl-D-erythritol synthase [Sulfitobacter donghicola DSW-25 = KCTC 12864 = JCM 14565]|uniref:4-diphosphocytidyl-2C-methyl-D-erythritol synthase n=1 Tax=Sulfitobacter donghicola DSW-25 = KCTC 12864 = JCM 14565 TaxID=1300350 RepID=A0A073ISG9_9RHOB|nr:4-diphosphocytidyl-2C-methyl-D-erythritol synthase [Sulfitobacter donghicola DSW-25 = KCTC 12864 = JCM 14565]
MSILILAAGASSRMRGRDKLLEQIDGEPLLRRQVKRALATGCNVVVTLPPSPHPRYELFDGLEAHLVAVADADEGMNASLRAGVAALPPTTKAVMVLLADMPNITLNDLNTMLEAVDLKSETKIYRATTQGGKFGHPILFHHSLFPDLIALVGDQGGKAVAQRYLKETTAVPLPDEHALTDLDTPEDWDRWRNLLPNQ